jgi:multidrug resistance efflux pump
MKVCKFIFFMLFVPFMAAEQQLSHVLSRGALIEKGFYYGEIDARTKLPVYAPESGERWSNLTVNYVAEDGTYVESGAVILSFDDTDLRANLREGEHQLRLAEARHELALLNLENELEKLELGKKRKELELQKTRVRLVDDEELLMPKVETEKIKLEIKILELELGRIKKEIAEFSVRRESTLRAETLSLQDKQKAVDRIRETIEKLNVQAPGAGVVYRPFVRLNNEMGKVIPGKVVSPGDKLLEIPDLHEFDVLLYVRQNEAVHIRPGDRAVVRFTAVPDQTWSATVRSRTEFTTTRKERLSDQTAAGNLKEINVVLSLEGAADFMRPGMTVQVELSSQVKESALILPLVALREKGEQQEVLVRSGKRWEPRLVTTGLSTSVHVEILSGLKEGEEVLLAPGL